MNSCQLESASIFSSACVVSRVGDRCDARSDQHVDTTLEHAQQQYYGIYCSLRYERLHYFGFVDSVDKQLSRLKEIDDALIVITQTFDLVEKQRPCELHREWVARIEALHAALHDPDGAYMYMTHIRAYKPAFCSDD